jgi:thymidine kinase
VVIRKSWACSWETGYVGSEFFFFGDTTMAKIYFRYGTVGSAKTLNLLAVAHNYQQQGKKVIVLKPEMDVRWGKDWVRSRAGLEREADVLIQKDSKLDMDQLGDAHCLLVDEVQFLEPSVIDQLRDVVTFYHIPVICYGLRTDFKGNLFPGALRLMEVADTIEEVKTTCAFCNSKAVMNLKLINGKATFAGPSIELGAEEKYLPVCYAHYRERLAIDNPDVVEMAVPQGWTKS